MAGLTELPKGPFLNIKNRGLVWIGVPEQCDRCKEIWPMSWITFTGTYFLCTACEYQVTSEGRGMEIGVAEDLNLIEVCPSCYTYYNITTMTISYNELICRKCAHKRVEKQRAAGEKERMAKVEKQREEYEKERMAKVQAEIEKEKALPAEERERREIERHKAYYDRMCS